MRPARLVVLALSLVVAAAACRDSVAPPSSSLAPGAALLAAGGAPKVTICHAAGLAGTTKYITLRLSANGASAHIANNGSPQAGHELDVAGACTTPPEPEATLVICIENNKTGLSGHVMSVSTDVTGPLGTLALPTFNPNGPPVPECLDPVSVPVGTVNVTLSNMGDFWVRYVTGMTVPAGNIGTDAFTGQDVVGAATMSDGLTTTGTFGIAH
jgi:hypothetical protein